MTGKGPGHMAGRKSLGVTVFAVSVTLIVLLAGTSVAMEFRYHSQKMMEKVLTQLTTEYPNITHLHSIGQSYRGKKLWVLIIGKHASQHTSLVPNVKYIANMHGNEVVGREMLLHLAEHLLINYGSNDTLTQFLDTTRVHLMPTMNPDGYSQAIREDCISTYGRGNAYGYDLNRNFPDPYATTPIQEQRETTLVREWIHATPFVLSANLHGGALVVNYPYDSLNGELTKPVYAATPDDDVYRHLALTFSRSHHTMHHGNSCMKNFEDGITNGANWYPVIGGMQDYMYRNASGYEVLIEMSCCKFPHVSELPRMWEVNRDALINFLLVVHMGVKGIIYHWGPAEDPNSWVPLEGATYYVEGREEATFTSTSLGEFYKLLLPSNYTLKVHHPSYEPVSFPFTVTESKVTTLDVYMRSSDDREVNVPHQSHRQTSDPPSRGTQTTTESFKPLPETGSPKPAIDIESLDPAVETENPSKPPPETENLKPSPETGNLNKPLSGNDKFDKPSTETENHNKPTPETGNLNKPSPETENLQKPLSGTENVSKPSTETDNPKPLVDSGSLSRPIASGILRPSPEIERKRTDGTTSATSRPVPGSVKPTLSSDKEATLGHQDVVLPNRNPFALQNASADAAQSAISKDSRSIACMACLHWGFYWGLLCVLAVFCGQTDCLGGPHINI